MSLTDRQIKAAKKKAKEYTLWDDNPRGLGLRVTPNGAKSFVVMRRLDGSKLLRRTIGAYGEEWSLKDAREEAGKLLRKIAKGVDPKAEKEAAREAAERRETGNFGKVADEFIKRYVIEKKALASRPEIERILRVYVRPRWKDKHVDDIDRADVNALLDSVVDNHGPVMADRVLAVVRKLFNWYATRDGKFVSPVVRDMARTVPEDRVRKRFMSDDEIRSLHAAWAKAGTFGDLHRFLLLTGARIGKAARIRQSELRQETINGKSVTVWVMPGKRTGNKPAYDVPLSPAALAILTSRPQIGKQGYFFTVDGLHPFTNFKAAKKRLNKALAADEWERWVNHDLRRTAKTLMERIGIADNISEAVLGHVKPGIEKTYGRYGFLQEKHRALRVLALAARGIVCGRTEPPKRAFMGWHLERAERLERMGRKHLSAVA